ncbi:MAG TPA: hypothetical protein VL523_09310 [Terriglobia bacterium]|nr:hypothetical protein [Terriglobia bacterium]
MLVRVPLGMVAWTLPPVAPTGRNSPLLERRSLHRKGPAIWKIVLKSPLIERRYSIQTAESA